MLDVVRAQARGDADAVLERLPACAAEPACARVTACSGWRSSSAPATSQILTYEPSVRITMTRATGTGRVAWRAGTSQPVVQCVQARARAR